MANLPLSPKDILLDDARFVKLGFRDFSGQAGETIADRVDFNVASALEKLKADPALGARLLYRAGDGNQRIYWTGDMSSEGINGGSAGVRVIRSAERGDSVAGENRFGEFLSKVRDAYVAYLQDNVVAESPVRKGQVISDFVRRGAMSSDIEERERAGERFIHVDNYKPVKFRHDAALDGTTGHAERDTERDVAFHKFECPFGVTPPSPILVGSRAEASYLYERALRGELDWEATFKDLVGRGLMSSEMPAYQRKALLSNYKAQFAWMREEICLNPDLRDQKIVSTGRLCDDASLGRSQYDSAAPSPADILARYVNNPVLLFSKPAYSVISALDQSVGIDEPSMFAISDKNAAQGTVDILVFGSDTIGGRIPGQRAVEKVVRQKTTDEDGNDIIVASRQFQMPMKPKEEADKDYEAFSKRLDAVLSGVPEGVKVRLVTGGMSSYGSSVGVGTPSMVARYVREKGGAVNDWSYERHAEVGKVEAKGNARLSALRMEHFYDAFPVLSKHANSVSFLLNEKDSDSEVTFRATHGIKPAGAVCFSVKEDRNNANILSAGSYALLKMPVIHVQENMTPEEQKARLEAGRRASSELIAGGDAAVVSEGLLTGGKDRWDMAECNQMSYVDKETGTVHPFVADMYRSPVYVDNYPFKSALGAFVALGAKENGFSDASVMRSIADAEGSASKLVTLAEKYVYQPGSRITPDREEVLLRQAVRQMVKANDSFREGLVELADRDIVMPVAGKDRTGLFTDLDGNGLNHFGIVLAAERRAVIERQLLVRQQAEDEQRKLLEAANRKQRAVLGMRVSSEMRQDGFPDNPAKLAGGVWFMGTNTPERLALPDGSPSFMPWDDMGGDDPLVREIASRPEFVMDDGSVVKNDCVFLFPSDLTSVTGRNTHVANRADSRNLTGVTRKNEQGKEYTCAWGIPVRKNNRGNELVNPENMPCSYWLDHETEKFMDSIVLADSSARSVALRNGLKLSVPGRTRENGTFSYSLANTFLEKAYDVKEKKWGKNPHASVNNLRAVMRYTRMLEIGARFPLNCICMPEKRYGSDESVTVTADNKRFTSESQFIADLKFSLKVAAATATMLGQSVVIPMKDGHVDFGPGVDKDLALKGENVVLSFFGMVNDKKLMEGELPLIDRIGISEAADYSGSLKKCGDINMRATDLEYAFGPYDWYYLMSGQQAPAHEMAFMMGDGTVFTLKESKWANGLSPAQVKEYTAFCESRPDMKLRDSQELNYRLSLVDAMSAGKGQKTNRFVIRSTDPEKLDEFLSALKTYCERAKQIKVETRLLTESEVAGKEESLNGFVHLLSSNSVDYAEDGHDIGKRRDVFNGESRFDGTDNDKVYYGHVDANDGFTGYAQMRYILPDGKASDWKTVRAEAKGDGEFSEMAVDIVMSTTNRKYRMDERVVPSPKDIDMFLIAKAAGEVKDMIRGLEAGPFVAEGERKEKAEAMEPVSPVEDKAPVKEPEQPAPQEKKEAEAVAQRETSMPEETRPVAEDAVSREKDVEPAPVVFTESDGGYAQRTRENANADDVDFTFRFGVDFETPGERCTAKAAGDSLVDIKMTLKESGGLDCSEKAVKEAVDSVVSSLPDEYLKDSVPVGINIAGNGIYTLSKVGVTQKQCDAFVTKVMEGLRDRGLEISSLRSGGQTGVDQSAVAVGQRLGVRMEIHAPNGWVYRDEKNVDHKGKEAFMKRFNLKPKAKVQKKVTGKSIDF